MQALVLAGHRDPARELAATFRAAHPDSLCLPAIDSALARPAP